MVILLPLRAVDPSSMETLTPPGLWVTRTPVDSHEGLMVTRLLMEEGLFEVDGGPEDHESGEDTLGELDAAVSDGDRGRLELGEMVLSRTRLDLGDMFLSKGEKVLSN